MSDTDESIILTPLDSKPEPKPEPELPKHPLSSKIRRRINIIIPTQETQIEETLLDDTQLPRNMFSNHDDNETMSLASWGKDIIDNEIAAIEEMIEESSPTVFDDDLHCRFKNKKNPLKLVVKKSKNLIKKRSCLP